MKINNCLTDLIGNTPLVKIQKMNEGRATVLVKLESFNPLSSVKDRAAFFIINAAEKDGKINKQTAIIEPTSGNTGIGLAYICAIKGYSLTLTMPDTMSVERRKLLAAFGAKLVLTDGTLGMSGAIAKAKELAAQTPNSFIPQQFENPANVQAHFETTGPEIWRDTEGKVDFFVSGVGTGGTITGVGKYLKSKKPSVQLVAVEPETSPVISGKPAGKHKIQGIGAGFIPQILDTSIIDRICLVSDENAGKTAREAAKKEGLLVGISSGAALWAALELSKKEENAQKTIVVILPDTGERYLSTWLFEDPLL